MWLKCQVISVLNKVHYGNIKTRKECGTTSTLVHGRRPLEVSDRVTRALVREASNRPRVTHNEL